MKQIKTLKELKFAVYQRKSIIALGSHFSKKPLPAAWVINLSGELLLKYFVNGMYVYEKKKGVKK